MVASIIDLKSMSLHSTPILAFRLPYVYQPIKTTFNDVYIVGRFTRIVDAMCRKRMFGEFEVAGK